MWKLSPAVAAAAIVATCSVDTAAQQLHPPARARIRSMNTRVTEVLAEGSRRSPTFKALIDRLEAAAVLVYIEPGRCPTVHRQRLNGCLMNLGAPGGSRHLRIIVDVGMRKSNLIATIGHELQHAVEASESAAFDNTQPEDALAGGAWRVGGSVYETDEAQQVEEDIRRELRRVPPDAPKGPEA